MTEEPVPSKPREMQEANPGVSENFVDASDMHILHVDSNWGRDQFSEKRVRTEIKNSYNDGFVLNEIELTRIKDVQNDLVKRINGGKDAAFEFQAKYHNGAIYKPLSLSDILAGENHGSSRVVRILMRAKDNGNNNVIVIQFSDVAHEGRSIDAISYSIQAQDKDWAFVAASTIDERIKKVKMPRATKIFSVSFQTLTSFVMLLALLAVMLLASSMDISQNQHILALEDAKRTAMDAVDFLYKYERFKLENNRSKDYLPYMMPGFMMLMFALVFGSRLLFRSFPMYNFCWGDYDRVYNRKVNILKFLFGTIMLSLLLGVLGNYLYGNLFS